MKIIEKSKEEEKLSLIIEGEMDIYSVKKLKEDFNKYFTKLKNIELDLSRIDKIDTAGFQFLALINREIKNNKKKFNIKNPSAEILRLFDLYGENIYN